MLSYMLNNPDEVQLIDEFFLELHFRCEIMMSCAWGSQIELSINGLIMDREHALAYFTKLRSYGIRAHFWP